MIERSVFCFHFQFPTVAQLSRWDTTSRFYTFSAMVNSCFSLYLIQIVLHHMVVLFENFITTFHACPAAFCCAANKFFRTCSLTAERATLDFF